MSKASLWSILWFAVIIWVKKSVKRSSAAPNDFNITSSKNIKITYDHHLGHNIHDDVSSLLALRDRLTTNTTLSENWTLEGGPFCSWVGVRCSKRHPFRVTALNLSYMGLQGTIPEEIGNLSFLSYLNIGNNSFSGAIPDTIGNLRRLRVLIMAYNELSGEIPPSIFNMSSLQRINLRTNRLFGNLPHVDMGHQLSNLQELDISDNQISGTIPESIFNISSLQLIRLGGNQISGTLPHLDICHHLPKLQVFSLRENLFHGDLSSSSLWECKQLEQLYLYSNNFNGTIPMHIGTSLPRLKVLSNFQNYFTGIIPNSIGNLSKLEALDLGSNNFHGRVPTEIGHLSNLKVLSLADNKLNDQVPVSVFNMSKLQSLGLSENKISGELPSSIATGLPNLEKLHIAQNRFSGVIPGSISNLSRIIGLDLFSNSFSGNIPANLGNIPNLEYLSLGANQFVNNLSIPEQDFLTPLSNSKHLENLAFDSIRTIVGDLPKSFFSSINVSAKLEEFYASECGITGKIPSEISNLTNLFLLSIGMNKLVGAIPESFGTLTKLQLLRSNHNMLQGSIPHSICNMKALYYMSLSGNKLSGQLPLCLGTDLPSLREIYLSENYFNSTIPLGLWFISGIQKIYLGYNFFNGTLPRELGNLKSLVELNISGNQLSGNIPSTVGQLQSLTILSVSNNRLNGSIPDSLSNMKGLEHLDLSHNYLSGPIPNSLTSLSYLEYFNVSFNQLSGEIPNEGPFQNFTAECFIGNKDLCGVPRLNLKPCKFVKPKISSRSRQISRYIIPSVLAFSIFVAAAIVFFTIRYRHKKSTNASRLSYDLPLGMLHERISYNDILQATRNFDEGNLIGRGSCGFVYKGEFSSLEVTAVKVFNLDTHGAFKSFDAECHILRSIRHRNLVKVITSCSNLDFKALVLEYMANGNLDRWLHNTEYSLNIFQRFEIMVDVAVALEYLHHGNPTPIIHCDVKPGNILLDDDMVAHVGDFGIAKLLTEEETKQTKTLGTIGYMAPEYGSGGFVSTAADVYSYGIVLMEIFTRKKPSDAMFSEESNMKKWVSESLISNSLMEILDLELLNTSEEDARGSRARCLTSTIELALECTSDVPEERPSMIEVAGKIKKIKINL